MNGYNNGYYNGFYNGYFNGANNGWGYYNVMDPNSGYGQVSYGPRGSTGGSNTDRRGSAGAGMEESGRRQYIQNAAAQQEKQPRFNAPPSGERRSNSSGRIMNSPGNRSENNPRDNERRAAEPAVQPNRGAGRRSDGGGRIQQRREAPQRESSQEQQKIQPKNNEWSPAPSRQGGGGNSGGSSPRGGSGGNSRPRR